MTRTLEEKLDIARRALRRAKDRRRKYRRMEAGKIFEPFLNDWNIISAWHQERILKLLTCAVDMAKAGRPDAQSKDADYPTAPD